VQAVKGKDKRWGNVWGGVLKRRETGKEKMKGTNGVSRFGEGLGGSEENLGVVVI